MENKGRVFFMRHGERVNAIYSNNWFKNCFNDKDEYYQFDLNYPKSIPKSKSKIRIANDPPLTNFGEFQTRLVGEAMVKNKINISHVFCSPALRCLQTCIILLRALGKLNLQVKIEPGFTDPIFTDALLNKNEIEQLGLKIDQEYTSIYSLEEVEIKETFLEFIQRLDHTTKYCLENINDKGNILIVAHGWMLNLPMKDDLGPRKFLSNEMLIGLIAVCPSVLFFELKLIHSPPPQQQQQKKTNSENKWNVINTNLIQMKNLKRELFNWKSFHETFLNLNK